VILPYRLRKIRHSALFQGDALPNGYFEGWYFKLTTKDGSTIAIIPGVSITENGNRTAFVQTIDGRNATTRYLEYDFDAFSSSRRAFAIKIGESVFSTHGIELHHDGDGHRIRGSIKFGPFSDIPRSVLAPGIMGWYRYVPRMECYHGVVSTDHSVDGSITLEGERIDFDGGRGYIEKDWGKSFPSSWVWLQCNGFPETGVSVMLSVAKIPWLGSSFVGFLGFLKMPHGSYRFGTYTGAKITKLEVSDTAVSITIASGSDRIDITAVKGRPGGLKAPARGAMERTIAESVSATVEVRMTGSSSYHSTGIAGGLEIAGDIDELGARRIDHGGESAANGGTAAAAEARRDRELSASERPDEFDGDTR